MPTPIASLSPRQQQLPTLALVARSQALAAVSLEEPQLPAALVAEGCLHSQLHYRLWQSSQLPALPAPQENSEWLLVPANPPVLTEPGLLLMDMDSTAIQIECIDEIARRGGVYQQVADVTERAMQGQMDFAEALAQRVAMLNGIPATVLTEIAAELPLMPGLIELCQGLKAHGWKIAIASGGFNAIASVLAAQLQLDYFEANELEVQAGLLTGRVLGDIVDANRKAQILVELGQRYRIPQSQWLAVGDGANDLPMLAAANLGVGFHAKPAVAVQADVAINQLGLDAILALLQR
ncbi:phosphoserine phosphatase SerB [Ferrimonas senticii]|uniref:phosphoserine phosphatase SerB n=1 Tax=Ferrimonas senticii TaxID=394566 RepID=UPI0003F85A4C|nr:phosphoserine phosphatase SerB [Ferrimonas senticii]